MGASTGWAATGRRARAVGARHRARFTFDGRFESGAYLGSLPPLPRLLSRLRDGTVKVSRECSQPVASGWDPPSGRETSGRGCRLPSLRRRHGGARVTPVAWRAFGGAEPGQLGLQRCDPGTAGARGRASGLLGPRWPHSPHHQQHRERAGQPQRERHHGSRSAGGYGEHDDGDDAGSGPDTPVEAAASQHGTPSSVSYYDHVIVARGYGANHTIGRSYQRPGHPSRCRTAGRVRPGDVGAAASRCCSRHPRRGGDDPPRLLLLLAQETSLHILAAHVRQWPAYMWGLGVLGPLTIALFAVNFAVLAPLQVQCRAGTSTSCGGLPTPSSRHVLAVSVVGVVATAGLAVAMALHEPW